MSVLLTIALCAGNTVCSTFWQNSLRNLAEFNIEKGDDLRIVLRNRQLAKTAWHALAERHPEQEFSIDYGRGFRAGFIDYLEFGGNGEPPPVPPFRYRLSPYQTPQGYRAILDWYAGFRHGAGEARVGGYRNTIVLPLSSPPVNAVPRDQAENKGPTSVEDKTGKERAEEKDVLPVPRPLQKTDGPPPVPEKL
jgi:hypothetical protein